MLHLFYSNGMDLYDRFTHKLQDCFSSMKTIVRLPQCHCSNPEGYTHPLGPLLQTWISNHIHLKVWNEVTYPFPNFKGATVEVWEWISNIIPDFIMDVITYPCWDLSKSGPCYQNKTQHYEALTVGKILGMYWLFHIHNNYNVQNDT